MMAEAPSVVAAKPIATMTNIRMGRYSRMDVELLHGLGERRHDLEQVPHQAVVGHLEDGGFGVLVDRDDATRRRHAGEMLDGAGDADRDIELRRHGLAGLPDLLGMGSPSRVDDGS